jgi:hypothetical protein
MDPNPNPNLTLKGNVFMKHGPDLAFIPHADPKKIAWSQKRLIDPTALKDAESDDEADE